jgi:RNA polymerase sigma-70 factor (ECF subfamily)
MTEQDIRTAYDAHKDAVYRFAWRMTGSASAAEDILQDCFLSLLRNPAAYDAGRAPVRAFLLGVARNLLRKRWRSEQRWDVLDEDDFVAEPIDPTAKEIEELVVKAIASLPALQREAVVLFEYEGLSIEEIAQSVDAEPGTVKARLHRARENLRRMLKGVRDGAFKR